MNLFGLPVVVSSFVEPQPVLQISPTFEYCGDEFRSGMNKWLLDLFGKREVAYFLGENAALGVRQQLVVSPESFAVIKELTT